MSKTSYRHDFECRFGEFVNRPDVIKDIMEDVYKMVKYKKALEEIRRVMPTIYDLDRNVHEIIKEALKDE